MADLGVERKETNMWAWIIGIILAVVLIWVLFSAIGGRDTRVGATDPNGAFTEQTPAPGFGEDQRAAGNGMYGEGDREGLTGQQREALGTDPVAITDEVAELRAFALRDPAQVEMGSEGEFTGEGLGHLAAALNSLADEADVRDDAFNTLTSQLEENADQLKENEASTGHAILIRQSFTTAAQALERIQAQAGVQAQDQIEQLRQAGADIQPNELLLNQREQVMGAFQQASESLTTFNQNMTQAGGLAS